MFADWIRPLRKEGSREGKEGEGKGSGKRRDLLGERVRKENESEKQNLESTGQRAARRGVTEKASV